MPVEERHLQLRRDEAQSPRAHEPVETSEEPDAGFEVNGVDAVIFEPFYREERIEAL
jgi:hypothetical protein